ncbi:hypothetical protein lerEdw1_004565 [Lerista edwardsae]|nr:hypothetical protein lerEdw1_004565 [Lerista edwardsae]
MSGGASGRPQRAGMVSACVSGGSGAAGREGAGRAGPGSEPLLPCRPGTWRRSCWRARRCWAGPSPGRCDRSSQVSAGREAGAPQGGPTSPPLPSNRRVPPQRARRRRTREAGAGGARAGAAAAASPSGLSLQEAQQILNVPTLDPEHIQKNYEHLFKVNDKAVGGSFYLQSKVVRAKERLDEELQIQSQHQREQDPQRKPDT